MGKYVYIYYAGDQAGEATAESTAAWGAWFGELGDKLMDGGNPFDDGGKAVEKTGVSTIENFPATGYTIVKADSMDEATKLAEGCPLLKLDGTAVRVYEALPM